VLPQETREPQIDKLAQAQSASRALFGARRHHYTPTGRDLKIVVPSIKIVSDIAHLTLQSDR
jgi:hypothetical protein